MAVKELVLEKRTKAIGVVESAFNELVELRSEDVQISVVRQILDKIPTIGMREENGYALLHFLAKRDMPATRIATEIALRERKAYPDVLNNKKESPLLVASASDNIWFVKRMDKYNRENGRPLANLDPQRPYKVNFERKNFAGQGAKEIAEFNCNTELAEIIGKVLRS
ncbi:MAG: hypothetical protein KGH54_02030 [Candidatus Micrarchaeota archaeon]|nr:hypothetical protein [Candidatus Micrarchaeota archaeon]